jgi:flagellar FliL protein
MAAKPALNPVPTAPAEVPAKKSKLLPIIAGAVLVSFLAGGAAWHFFGPHANAAAGAAKAEKPVAKNPSFMTLETFTVNLAGAEHFLQLGVVLQLDSDKTAEDVKIFLPRIRNDILLLLSSKSAADLDAPGGKQKLADEILAVTRKPLDDDAKQNVQGVLFSSLVVQ